MRLRAAGLSALSLAAALFALWGCTTLNSSPAAHPAMIAFYMRQVCLPHLESGVPVAEIARRTGLHRVDSCDLVGGCLHRHCSADPRLGCVDLQEGYCSLVLTADRDFDGLDREVRSVLAVDPGRWTPVPPTATKAGYGSAFCNAADSVGVETFGVTPDRAPLEIKTAVYGPEYDLNLSTLAEPGWCLRRRQAGAAGAGGR